MNLIPMEVTSVAFSSRVFRLFIVLEKAIASSDLSDILFLDLGIELLRFRLSRLSRFLDWLIYSTPTSLTLQSSTFSL